MFSEDALNLWDTNAANRHKVRFFPLRDKSGAVVPNAYIAAFEEFDTAFDSNDIVVVLRNVKPAASGPEIGLENLDGTSFTDRLTFSRIQNPDNTAAGKPNNLFHDTAKLRIRNTGTSALVLNSLTLNNAFFQLVNPPAAGTSIAAGSSLDLTVKFVSTTGDMKLGTLTINSNDSDEPGTVVELAGFWQSRNEGNQEPLLQEVFNTFGYKTQAVYPGETLSQGGRIIRTGDEVLSPYWLRSDTSRPSPSGRSPPTTPRATPPRSTGSTRAARPTRRCTSPTACQAQTFLPTKDTAGTQPAYALFSPAAGQAFGWKVDGEYSDPAKNKIPVGQPQDQGHHVRFWVAPTGPRDHPRTYLMSMDYAGINYDYNDNTYLISNVRPVSALGPHGADGRAGDERRRLRRLDDQPRGQRRRLQRLPLDRRGRAVDAIESRRLARERLVLRGPVRPHGHQLLPGRSGGPVGQRFGARPRSPLNPGPTPRPPSQLC